MAECLRGVCQGTIEDWNLGGVETYDYGGGARYCYRDQASSDQCADGYACSLPDIKHGHQSVAFSFRGTNLIYMTFGGETSDLIKLNNGGVTAGSGSLSNLVHTAYFTSDEALFVQLITSCNISGGACPKERRDAAIALMGNSGTSNGRLLVFGGITCSGTQGCTRSVTFDYLDGGSGASVNVLDDLWSPVLPCRRMS
eukprot:102419-Hanusia_phi.AAC.2